MSSLDIVTMVLIALSLSMDAFAVSITSGLAIKYLKINNALKIALFFGLFQAIMPVMGWLSVIGFVDLISGIDHFIAFGLLSLIGCRMIYESFRIKEDKKGVGPLNNYVLFILSIATSIDALAIGVSFAFLKISIITPIIVIGTVTFIISFFGVFIGNMFGHFFERRIEALGGLILIAIGVRILIEHLF